MSELRVHRNIEQPNFVSRTANKLNIVKNFFGEDGFNFKDIVDLINPLHHIPIVGSIYRAISNDKIAPAIKLAGGALFGGPAGASLAAMGLVVDKNKPPQDIKINSNHDNLSQYQLKEKVINIDDLVAQRKFPSSKNNLSSLNSSGSKIPSVKNYESFLSSYQEKFLSDTSHLPSKKRSQFVDLQLKEDKAILLKKRIDRRL